MPHKVLLSFITILVASTFNLETRAQFALPASPDRSEIGENKPVVEIERLHVVLTRRITGTSQFQDKQIVSEGQLDKTRSYCYFCAHDDQIEPLTDDRVSHILIFACPGLKLFGRLWRQELLSCDFFKTL